ncbi:MAG: membrane-bound lytic murein transglycosylase MltF [Gammaproteobacteria bacterium]|nr:membrane-bound lytic murein transglycosylase MltF [Gammaproteobacteria bacterium]
MQLFENRTQCFKIGIGLLTTFLTVLLFFNFIPNLAFNQLEKVLSRGELTVITRNSPTTFYETTDGDTGLEYDLIKGFADSLGVKFKIVIANKFNDILPTVTNGHADFAAAGLSITDERLKIVKFTPSYQEVKQQVIYHRNNIRPKTLEDLFNKHIEIVSGSSHSHNLRNIAKQNSELSWTDTETADSDQLLYLVAQKLIDNTISDSNEFMIYRHFFPELDVAFDISEPEKLAWAFPKSNDDSLFKAASDYLIKIKNNGTLKQIIERHYGHTEKFDYVGVRRFVRHISTRLKFYKSHFINAAEKNNLDWKLLAAAGYQESHWNTRAISPTGVRGIMMLTRRTAGQLGVKNRLNAKSSIFGGAKYLSHLISRMDEDIPEPDRTWMALASYNVGFGHLADARKITEKLGKDPNKWIDVKSSLPLLAQRRWYKKTKYGYARGWEPVKYVENIRSYYDLLSWEINKSKPAAVPEPASMKIMPNIL